MTVSVFGTALLVSGSESLLSSRVIEERTQAALAEQPEAEVNRIQGSELADVMLSEVAGGSLFASHIIAIIDDVGATPSEVFDALIALARTPGPELCLILNHEGGNKGRGLIDKLKKARIEVRTVAAPKPWDLPKVCVEEAKRLGMRMSLDAAGALVAAVGTDLRSLVAAVSQLAADAEGRQIDADLIRRYFAGRAEVTAFAVVDAVLAGDTSQALEKLRWSLGTGTAPVLFTSAFAGAFRAMGQLLDARGNPSDLAARMGVPPFKVKDYQRHSRHWQPAAVAASIKLIARADAEVKGAAVSAEYALEKLVLGVLAQRRR